MDQQAPTNPQPPVKAEYLFKSANIIGKHVAQVGIDNLGNYSVATSGRPLDLAQKLREIAAHIEEMETQDAVE